MRVRNIVKIVEIGESFKNWNDCLADKPCTKKKHGYKKKLDVWVNAKKTNTWT